MRASLEETFRRETAGSADKGTRTFFRRLHKPSQKQRSSNADSLGAGNDPLRMETRTRRGRAPRSASTDGTTVKV